MRNLKKFLALVLAMVMAFSLMVTANAANPKTDYPDMDKVLPEFEEAVDVLSGMGVFRGNNGKFLPQDKIMRCEAVAILYRLVTGDVNDTQKDLYKPLANQRFTDVKENDWFAGYVGFAVDAGYINGYNGKFMPYQNVTGYEMLKMLLKAVGYGKNGEFTGALWQINVGSTAQSLNILADIESTHYANTLSQASPREVVADLTFNVAAYVPTVRYELGYYNQYKGVALAQGNNEKNPTLGQSVFNLYPWYGHIIGNQATGEAGTLLDGGIYTYAQTGNTEDLKDQYGYVVKVVKTALADGTPVDTLVFRFVDNDMTKGLDPNWDLTDGSVVPLTVDAADTYADAWNVDYRYGFGNRLFDFKTGLNQFAHQVTIWYNRGRQNGDGAYSIYALLDHVKSDEAFYSDSNTVGGVAGQSIGTVLWSDRFSRIGRLPVESSDNLSRIATYRKVVNPNGTVYIALNAEVGYVEEVNSTARVPYLSLGNQTAATSNFTNSKDVSDQIFLSCLTSDTKDEQKKTGALVTAYQIVGTKCFNLADANGDSGITSDDDWKAVRYQLDPMKTKTITVSTYQAPTGAVTINGVADCVTAVYPAGGDVLLLSGITDNDHIVSLALPIATKTTGQGDNIGKSIVPMAGVTYTVYEDIVGRFISMVPANNTRFIYGTYAGYDMDGYTAGTIKYNMVGVDWNAKIQEDNTIKSMGTAPAEQPISGAVYNSITVTKKDQGNGQGATIGNEIQSGVNTGYMYNEATGNLDPTGLNGTQMDTTTWSFSSSDASYGFKRVISGLDAYGNPVDYLVTNDTEFIIVSGTGMATLKVSTAKGISGLLGGGSSAEITYAAGMNMVYFQTDTDLFGTIHTGDNAVIMKVILSDDNLTRWDAKDLYFNYRETDATGVKLPYGATTRNIEQYKLWKNGEVGYYFIDVDASLKSMDVDGNNKLDDAWTATTDIEPETFYTLARLDDVNGIPVYKAIALASPAAVDYTTGYNSKQAGAPVIYDYVTVNNRSTALVTKSASELVYSISSNVKVCDVQWLSTPNATNALNRNEIKNVLELNNAVSVKQNDASTAVYDDIEVAVVYNGSVIECIYVTAVPVPVTP